MWTIDLPYAGAKRGYACARPEAPANLLMLSKVESKVPFQKFYETRARQLVEIGKEGDPAILMSSKQNDSALLNTRDHTRLRVVSQTQSYLLYGLRRQIRRAGVVSPS